MNRLVFSIVIAVALSVLIYFFAAGSLEIWGAEKTNKTDQRSEREWTRVIVEFRIPSGGKPEEQRSAIVEAREALLRELASAPYRVTRVFDTSPLVSLAVSPEALRILEKSTRVVRMQKDSLNAPLWVSGPSSRPGKKR